jgi:vacuolar-type H+-ATPase subunit H
MRAQSLVDQASQERDRIIQQALAEARGAEDRFVSRIPEIQQSFVSKAERRAEQTISELARRYEEREQQLRDLAKKHKGEVSEAAFVSLLDPSSYP